MNLIAATTTTKGLTVRAELDPASYPPGLQVSDEQLAHVQLQPDAFHGDWNYMILPSPPTAQ